MRRPDQRAVGSFVAAVSVTLWVGCASPSMPASEWQPALFGDGLADVRAPASEVRELQLIAANLVSALVQLPEHAPGNSTLQISRPATPFGAVTVRALEDAGYGLQLVSADQGAHYVGYRRRVSETDAGDVIDFGLSIGALALSREYTFDQGRVFPSSLMVIDGIEAARMPRVNDAPFSEQGGGQAFVSGIREADGSAATGSISEVQAREFDEIPLARRTAVDDVVDAAERRATLEREGAALELDDYERRRRTVLIFDHDAIERMGAGNKEAVRLLVRDRLPGDRFVISACTDVDGRNDAAASRALRVRQELLSHDLPDAAVRIAPCRRASFRHASDRSPVPVEIVQYRSPT